MLRAAMTLVAFAIFAASPAAAAETTPPPAPIEIQWRDLVPKAKTQKEQDSRDQLAAALSEFMGGGHSAMSMTGAGPGLPGGGEALVETYDAKRVRMAGYALPLNWSDEGFTEFLLVPYVGACVHVPPPPANQLVLIKTDKPYKPSYIFEPVNVTGQFSRFKHEIDDIQSGYRIDADKVEPYEE